MKKIIIISFALCICMLNTGFSQVDEQDSLALVAFYNSTGGPEWTINDNWLTGAPVSNWYGVTVSGNRVEQIDLYENNLVGTLPAEIGAWTALQRLYLPSNFISGEIPPEIGQCTSLYALDLYVNEISGTFPPEISNCQALSSITIYRNEMSGPFPEVLLSLPFLWRLELGSNNFEGPIPAEINNHTVLRLLDLHRNDFSGQMISLKNMTQLTEVHLSSNNLHGDIADIIDNCPNMYYFTLSNNRFTGCMSDTFFNPEKIQFLDFGDNDFDCVGDFSAFIDTGVLQRLSLYDNRIAFEYLEPNRGVNQYNYTPQQMLLDAFSKTLTTGDSLLIQSGSQGTYTHYQWFKDGSVLLGEEESTLWISSFDASKAGEYHCVMTNDSLPLLTLVRNPVTLLFDGTSGIRDVKYSRITISPNPVTDWLDLPAADPTSTASVFDMTGRPMRTNVINIEGRLDVSFLTQGLYILMLHQGTGISTGIFMKASSR